MSFCNANWCPKVLATLQQTVQSLNRVPCIQMWIFSSKTNIQGWTETKVDSNNQSQRATTENSWQTLGWPIPRGRNPETLPFFLCSVDKLEGIPRGLNFNFRTRCGKCSFGMQNDSNIDKYSMCVFSIHISPSLSLSLSFLVSLCPSLCLNIDLHFPGSPSIPASS